MSLNTPRIRTIAAGRRAGAGRGDRPRRRPGGHHHLRGRHARLHRRARRDQPHRALGWRRRRGPRHRQRRLRRHGHQPDRPLHAVDDRFECESGPHGVPPRRRRRRLLVSSLNFDIPVEVYGGDGNDNLSGYSIASKAKRHLLDGGAGTTSSTATTAPDVVRGGPGDDEVDGRRRQRHRRGRRRQRHARSGDHYDAPGTDTIDGGAGFDHIESDYVIPGNDFNPPVAISFDGAANDGRPGENDNLAGVEKLDSSVSGDVHRQRRAPTSSSSRPTSDQGDSTIAGAGGATTSSRPRPRRDDRRRRGRRRDRGRPERRHAHRRARQGHDPRRLDRQHVQLPLVPDRVRQRRDRRARRRAGHDRLRRRRGPGDGRRDRRRDRLRAGRQGRRRPARPPAAS